MGRAVAISSSIARVSGHLAVAGWAQLTVIRWNRVQTIAGMKATGRRLGGPGVDLVEVVNEAGAKHTALVVDPALRDHPTLHSELEFAMGFMERPDVTGLARLVAHSPDEGAFVYPTGTVWSVAEVVRELADVGEVAGVKAGLELCYLAGEILVEAADKSAQSGLASHGSVDPWKLVFKADGQVLVIGYGLPRLEIEAWLDDDSRPLSEDALRYCAPEDLKPDGEPDLGADLFALSLIALELMVGRPVYDGLVPDVKQQASRGEAARKLYQWRDRIPEPVREVLGRALKPDADTRYRDGLDYVYSVHDLLGGIDAGDGPSLREIVTKVRARQKRGRAAVGGRTAALSKEELAELAADIDAEGVATDIPAPRRPRPSESEEESTKPRWKRATRSRAGLRGRRRRAGTEGARAEPSARDRLLQRLRERGQGREATESPKRRRRPGGRAAALLERLRTTEETPAPAPPRSRRSSEEPGPPKTVDTPPKTAKEPLPAPAGEAAPTSVLVRWKGRALRLPRDGGTPVELAEEAARRLGLVAVDGLGTRVASYRFGVAGKLLPPDAAVPDEVDLLRVPNAPRVFTVVTPDGSRARIVLGGAVPVRDLLPVLGGMLGLEPGFALYANGRSLGGERLLAEFDGVELEVRR